MRTSMHELTLNGLPLDNRRPADGVDYQIGVRSRDFKPGSHEAILSVVRALGADGSSVREEGADNAETTFLVEISGPDLTSLAEGEADLRRVFPRNAETVELIHRPADGVAPAAVRDVVHGALGFDWDDISELRNKPTRVFPLTLTHLPYVRSEFPSTTAALPVGTGTRVVVDTCDSTTGWSGTALGLNETVVWSVDSGALVGTIASPYPNRMIRSVDRAGAINMAGTRYLTVDCTQAVPGFGIPSALYLRVPGADLAPVRSIALGDDMVRYVFDCDGIASIALKLLFSGQPTPLRIDEVGRQNYLSETPRQQMRTLAVGGTERSPGSIHVAQRTGTDPIGPTLIHTSPHQPGGYDPDLLRWANAAGAGDPTVPAGATWDLSAADVITYSPSSSYPEGPYVLYAYVRSASTQSVRFSRTVAGSIPGGTVFREIHQRSEYVSLTMNKWTLVSIGLESLPAMRGPLGNTWIVIGCNGAPGITLGGFWALAAGDDCSLTIVDAEQPHLYIDSPKVGQAADVWCSAVADRHNGYYPSGGVTAAGLPVLSAGLTDVYVVTTGADNAAVDYSHHRRWTHHPADDGTTP